MPKRAENFVGCSEMFDQLTLRKKQDQSQAYLQKGYMYIYMSLDTHD